MTMPGNRSLEKNYKEAIILLKEAAGIQLGLIMDPLQHPPGIPTRNIWVMRRRVDGLAGLHFNSFR